MSTAIGTYADFDDDTGSIPGSPSAGELRVYNVGDILNQQDSGSNVSLFAYADTTQNSLMTPVGRSQDSTAAHALNETTLFAYIGKASGALSSIDICLRVTTVPGGSPTLKVGVCVGPLVANGNAVLTFLADFDITSLASTPGAITVPLSLPGPGIINAGDDIWLYVYDSSMSAHYAIRIGVPDEFQSGGCQSYAGDPSQWGGPTTTALTSVVAWLEGVASW